MGIGEGKVRHEGYNPYVNAKKKCWCNNSKKQNEGEMFVCGKDSSEFGLQSVSSAVGYQ